MPNDLGYIISRSRITKIYANGAKSKQLYDKYLSKQLGIEAVQLPSTSPANTLTIIKLLEYWKNVNVSGGKTKVMKRNLKIWSFQLTNPFKEKNFSNSAYIRCVSENSHMLPLKK